MQKSIRAYKSHFSLLCGEHTTQHNDSFYEQLLADITYLLYVSFTWNMNFSDNLADKIVRTKTFFPQLQLPF